MSCDDMYVCERGVRIATCYLKIQMGKCDKFSSVEEYEKFIKEKETTRE